MKPSSAPEGVKERLVEEDGLHGVQVEVTYVHLEDLEPLEEVEEGYHLRGEDLEHDELKVTHCLRQRLPPVECPVVVPVLADGAII